MKRILNVRFKPILNWLERLSGWLLLLTIFWLCWALSKLLWLLLAPPQPPNLPPTPLQPAATAPVDYASSFMLFEQSNLNQQPVQPPPNIVLKGTMLAEPEQYSSALLEVNGLVKNYRVGEMVDNSNYKVVAVSWNEVMLENPNDQQTVVVLRQPMALDQGPQFNDQPKAPASNQSAPMANNGLDSSMMDTPEQMATEQEDNAASNTPQAAIGAAAEELRQDPASYLSRMGVMATGEGYQVTAAMPDKLKNRLGLEPGDKVLSVNGQSVGNNPRQDASLLEQVKQSGEAQLEVQRGEQVITIRQQF